MNVLSFDSEAAATFVRLRQSGVRVGTMDLRIGSIALVRGFTVLTRNTVDFVRIPACGGRLDNIRWPHLNWELPSPNLGRI